MPEPDRSFTPGNSARQEFKSTHIETSRGNTVNASEIIERAGKVPQSLSITDVMQMQKILGNRSARQLIRQPGIGNTAANDLFVQNSKSIQKKENRTGLPDSLKTGVENLSGISFDDVKVHYNSDKPSQIGALAYTQGTDIHVAPGQERHLPHEAWHVAQQAQGRVQPTMQMSGLPINDDNGLEHEADQFGMQAMNHNTIQPKRIAGSAGFKQDKTIQRVVVNKHNEKITYRELKEYIEKKGLQIDELSDLKTCFQDEELDKKRKIGILDFLKEVKALVSSEEDEEEDESGDDEDFVPEEFPSDYKTPSEFYDAMPVRKRPKEVEQRIKKYQGKVLVRRNPDYNKFALIWLNALREEQDFELQGNRKADEHLLGHKQGGYTWHHCDDYHAHRCTMQQVPTEEHQGWGHVGGAKYEGYGDSE